MRKFFSRFIFHVVFPALLLPGTSAIGQLNNYTADDAFPGLSFANPVCIASPPGETNRVFVLEQNGVVVVITNLASPTRTVFLDLTDRVTFDGNELGLLGIAFHPGFATNRYLYIYYTGPATNGGGGLHDILSRFQAWTAPWDPNMGDPASEVRLIVQPDDESNHNAGDVHFGADGYLYLSLGDEGGGGDSSNNSQRIDKDFFSGIIRIDVDKLPGNLPPNPHPASTANYSIPSDNPFVGATSFNGSSVNSNNVRTEFWAVGLRNPWRWSFDPPTGFAYCGDVGQGAREEIDVITKGGNYGWAYREGNIAGPKSPPGGFTSRIDPIFDYDRGVGNCVIGGVVYRGSRFPDLIGYYVFADIGSGRFFALKYNGTNITTPVELFNETGISAFGHDPSNGDVLFANLNSSRIRRLVAVAPPGSLQVTIDPAGAVISGAQWRVDTGAFHDSGDTAVGLAPGNHTVSFKTVPGWSAPANKTVEIVSGNTTTTNGTYLSTDVTKPSVAITSPRSGQRVSNELFTVSGNANDNVALASVYCQANSNAWQLATGTTSWSADVNLIPGNNTLRAYAIDAAGNLSRTSSMNLFYSVAVPLVVQIDGLGSVNPDLNGDLLEIGKSYSMSAKAGKGFKFVNWTGSASNNNSKLTFVMASNLTFIAHFIDVKAPIVIVTFPSVNKKVTNSVLNVAGKASDNVGVDSVWYQLNGGGAGLATTTNGWTNWLTAGLTPNLGNNLIQAWGADAAGNISKTNSVKFVYVVIPPSDFAPDSLSGWVAQATPESNNPAALGFDALTFSKTGVDTNDEFSVGGYTYVKTGTNTAEVSLVNTAPPTQTNDSAGTVSLIFTNHYSGTFSNEDGTGGIRFQLATNFSPTTVSNKKIVATGTHGTHTVSFKSNGTFTLTPSLSGAAMSSVGTFTFKRYSPIGAMTVLTFTGADAGATTYVQLTFTSSKAGNFLATTFNILGTPTDIDPGTFELH